MLITRRPEFWSRHARHVRCQDSDNLEINIAAPKGRYSYGYTKVLYTHEKSYPSADVGVSTDGAGCEQHGRVVHPWELYIVAVAKRSGR
jgi:hypothetical protein